MLNWISDRVIVNPQLRIYEARLPSDRAVTWEAEGRRLSQKETTNQNLSAANFTAGDFSIALFFHFTVSIFSPELVMSLNSSLSGGRKASFLPFPPRGIEYLVIVRRKVTSTLIFHNCRLPRLSVSDPETPSTVRHRDGRHVPAHQRIADNQFIIIVAAAHCNTSAMKMWNVLV